MKRASTVGDWYVIATPGGVVLGVYATEAEWLAGAVPYRERGLAIQLRCLVETRRPRVGTEIQWCPICNQRIIGRGTYVGPGERTHRRCES